MCGFGELPETNIMKFFQVLLVSAVLFLPSSNCQELKLELSGLRADLEYLRGYWLKNPGEYDRQGRIVFSHNYSLAYHVIKVNYGFPPSGNEKCPSDIADQWTKESLYLENIHHLLSNDSTNTSIGDLFYKSGSFYSRDRPCDVPQPLNDHEVWVEFPLVPTIVPGDDKKTVQVSYVCLETLGYDLERQLSQMDFTERLQYQNHIYDRQDRSNKRDISGILINGDNKFTFNYETDFRYVDVDHVRILETLVSQLPPVPDFSDPHQASEDHVSFLVSTDYPFIRYDRPTKSFYTPSKELLDGGWFVRPVGEKYVLKDAIKIVVSPVSVMPIPTGRIEERRRRKPLRQIAKKIQSFGTPIARTIKTYREPIVIAAASGALVFLNALLGQV